MSQIEIAGQAVRVVLPEDAAYAKAQATAAAASAAGSQLLYQAMLALAGGRVVTSTGAGEAATTTGQYYVLIASGSIDLYLRTGGGSTKSASMPALDLVTGQMLGQNGSAAAPAFSFASDPDTGLYRVGVNSLGLVVGGVVAALIASTGRLALGNAATNYLFNLALANPARGILADITNSDAAPNGAMQSYTQNGITNNCFGMVPASADMAIWFNRNAGADGTLAWRWQSDGHYRPGADNSYDVGTASFRGRTAYFGTGAINTSDGREKSAVRAFSAAELRAAKRIAAEIGVFQFLDGARLHVGVIAQAVWGIMADEGLVDPIADGVTPDSAYAFLCYDKWDADAVNGTEAGDRFGIRPDQLALFLIAAQEARLAAIEAAL